MVPFQKDEVSNLTSLTDLGSKYVLSGSHTHMHTTILRLYGFCPGQPGLLRIQESLANAKVNARQHCVSLSCILEDHFLV